MKEQNLTYLYITHDLAVAESVCSRIVVMYLGKIVEWVVRKRYSTRPNTLILSHWFSQPQFLTPLA